MQLVSQADLPAPSSRVSSVGGRPSVPWTCIDIAIVGLKPHSAPSSIGCTARILVQSQPGEIQQLSLVVSRLFLHPVARPYRSQTGVSTRACMGARRSTQADSHSASHTLPRTHTRAVSPSRAHTPTASPNLVQGPHQARPGQHTPTLPLPLPLPQACRHHPK